MKLYFLRHGAAVEAAEWEGSDDDRPLTKDGSKRMEREAKAIAELQIEPDAILTSPLLRAKQTATIVADALKMRGRLREDERVGTGFGVHALESILRDYSKADAIMLVGHEPSMSTTIGNLIGNASIDLKKGGLACVELEPDSLEGVLLWLIPPKALT